MRSVTTMRNTKHQTSPLRYVKDAFMFMLLCRALNSDVLHLESKAKYDGMISEEKGRRDLTSGF